MYTIVTVADESGNYEDYVQRAIVKPNLPLVKFLLLFYQFMANKDYYYFDLLWVCCTS